MLKCGISKEKINPEIGMEIPGYFEVRRTTGVLTDLYAKAVVFEKDGELCVLCVLDSIFTNRNDVLSIRRKAQELCGIEPENIFVWATHSHTAGPVSDIFHSKRDKKYIRFMTDMAAKAINDACNSRREAKVGSTTGKVEGIAFVRRFFMEDGTVATNPGKEGRLNPEGEPDETYTLIRIDDATSGKAMGFISNFGLHLDTVKGELACSDYPGYLAEMVNDKFGNDVESIFLTGPCGDVNHINFDDREKTNTAKQIAVELFHGLCELNENISCEDGAELAVKTLRFLAPLREEDDEKIKWAYGIADGAITAEKALGMPPDLRARAIIEIDKRIEDTVEIEVGAITLGNSFIIQWPGEIFVNFGRSVRGAHKGKDVLIGENGGGSLSCYIPTEEAFKRGGYEPTTAGAYCARPDFGNRLVKETLKMLEK